MAATPFNKRRTDGPKGADQDSPRPLVGATKTKRHPSDLITQAKKIPAPLAPFKAFLRRAQVADRVQVEKQGLSYITVQRLMSKINYTPADMQRLMGISRSAYMRKMAAKQSFSGVPGQTLIGLVDLINRADDMLSAEQDSPIVRDFDIEKWVGEWIRTPQPALGGREPSELMDTPTGRTCVMRLLGSLQSGAYL